VGGVVGGLALIACIAAFIVLIRRIRKVEQQGVVYENDARDKGAGTTNTQPVVEKSGRYGAPQGLRYPDDLQSGNVQEVY